MEGDVLSPENRNEYEQHIVASLARCASERSKREATKPGNDPAKPAPSDQIRNQQNSEEPLAESDKEKNFKKLFGVRMAAVQWLVYRELQRAADCLLDKLAQTLFCPLGFLAGIYDMVAVNVIPGPFEPMGAPEVFYIATDKALANGSVLLLQARELLDHHGPDIVNYFQEPMKSLFDQLPALEAFVKGEEVELRPSHGVIAPGSKRR
jgi:hypothetical protein